MIQQSNRRQHHARPQLLRLALRTAFLLGALLMVPVSLQAQAEDPPVVVRGTVMDTLGRPIAGASVSVGGSHAAYSDSRGRFMLNRVPVGPARLAVRRLGFRPWQGTVEIEAAPVQEVRVSLRPTSISLETVVVRTTPREVFDSRLAGFEARRTSGGGSYIDRSQIESLSSASLIDVLRRMRGVRITTLGNTMMTRVRIRNASCPPLVFVDGYPAHAGEFDLGMVEVSSLEGVEVYHGMAGIPAQFVSGQTEAGCGVVALWSRPARRVEPRARAAVQRPVATELEPVDVAELLASGNVYTADQVDVKAELERGTRLPVYPDSLFQAGITGQVLVEFVVNIVGNVEPATIHIVSSSHPLFAASVREAVLSARFSSAMIGAARVRQVVHLPFEFEILPSASEGGASPVSG
ncbi:MAG TPA: TonB family protein [Gemmatimonadales bacterium]|nr:TonB family protein [Gemmatimonadales bacterium]